MDRCRAARRTTRCAISHLNSSTASSSGPVNSTESRGTPAWRNDILSLAEFGILFASDFENHDRVTSLKHFESAGRTSEDRDNSSPFLARTRAHEIADPAGHRLQVVRAKKNKAIQAFALGRRQECCRRYGGFASRGAAGPQASRIIFVRAWSSTGSMRQRAARKKLK